MQSCDNPLLVIHVGDQSDAEGDFWQTLPCRQFTEPFGGTFCYLTRVGRAPTLRPSGNFSFGDVFFKAW